MCASLFVAIWPRVRVTIGRLMFEFLLAAIYGAVTLIFLTLTFAEGQRGTRGWDGMRVLGLVLCFAWPPVVAVLVVARVVGIHRLRAVREFLEAPATARPVRSGE